MIGTNKGRIILCAHYHCCQHLSKQNLDMKWQHQRISFYLLKNIFKLFCTRTMSCQKKVKNYLRKKNIAMCQYQQIRNDEI